MINKKRLLRNSSLSFTLNLTVKAANVLIFIIVGRLDGVAQAGFFSLTTTYLLIVSALALGLDELLIRQVARDHKTTARYFGAFLTLRVVLSVGLYIVMVGVVRYAFQYESATERLILILGFSLIPDSLALVGQSVFIAHERFEIPVIAAMLSGIIKTVGAIAAIQGSIGLIGVGWAWIIGSTCGSILVLITAKRLAGRIQLFAWADRQFWVKHFQMGIPFLAIGFVITLEYQLDVIILKSIRSDMDVGWYSAVTTIVFALTLFSQAYRVAIYPRMVNDYKSSPDALGRIYHLSFYYLGTAALPMAMGITLLSRPIIHLVYGPAFEGAILPLKIIVWSIIFLYLNVPNSRLMLVSERQVWLAWLVVVSMGINFALNLILDPALGAVGAAIARLVSTAAFFFPNYIYVTRYMQPHNMFRSLAKPMFATLLMAAAVWPLRHLSIWIPILAGVVVYAGTLLLLDKGTQSLIQMYL